MINLEHKLNNIENLLQRILHNQTNNGISYDAQQIINLKNAQKSQQGLSSNMFKQGVSPTMMEAK